MKEINNYMDINKVRTFEDCCLYCLSLPELIEQFNRLYNTNIKALGNPIAERTPIEAMIDKTGYSPDKKELHSFFNFVYECIWSRLPDEAFKD